MAYAKEDIGQIKNELETTISVMDGDKNVTAELDATIREFYKKYQMVASEASKTQSSQLDERIIELEQAADSAKAAVEANNKLSESLKKHVREAHNLCSHLKRSLKSA